jgi:hypothetical protein
MLYPQWLRVWVQQVKGPSPSSRYLQYPCWYVAVLFLGEETLKTQILWYFSLLLRVMMRVMAVKLGENALSTPNNILNIVSLYNKVILQVFHPQ